MIKLKHYRIGLATINARVLSKIVKYSLSLVVCQFLVEAF
jgi:hypothetical protein